MRGDLASVDPLSKTRSGWNENEQARQLCCRTDAGPPQEVLVMYDGALSVSWHLHPPYPAGLMTDFTRMNTPPCSDLRSTASGHISSLALNSGDHLARDSSSI